MTRKIIFSKHLLKGRFYLHSDRHGGHPAYLYKKRDNKNMYFIILFSTKKSKSRKRLKHSIEPSKVKQSYVQKSPSCVKRRYLKPKELVGLKIHKDDKPLIESIKRKK